jgi:hypothetical protein
VILRKTMDAPFRASLEIATANSPVNVEMLERYKKGAAVQREAALSKYRLAELTRLTES